MQLTFELESSPLMSRLRESLLALFGPQPCRGEADPLSQLILALIGARTPDKASAAAFAQLRDAFADWGQLATAAPKRIEAAIGQVAFADHKARQLPTLIRVIQIRAGTLDLDFLRACSVDAALEWLQSLPGIGCKTAAATLNFSRLRRRALVVDAHVHRVARRLGLVGRTSDTAQAYATLMAMIPASWSAEDLFELHWLIKGLGRSICVDAAPLCGQCPLKAGCARVGIGVGRKVIDFSAPPRTADGAPEAACSV